MELTQRFRRSVAPFNVVTSLKAEYGDLVCPPMQTVDADGVPEMDRSAYPTSLRIYLQCLSDDDTGSLTIEDPMVTNLVWYVQKNSESSGCDIRTHGEWNGLYTIAPKGTLLIKKNIPSGVSWKVWAEFTIADNRTGVVRPMGVVTESMLLYTVSNARDSYVMTMDRPSDELYEPAVDPLLTHDYKAGNNLYPAGTILSALRQAVEWDQMSHRRRLRVSLHCGDRRLYKTRTCIFTPPKDNVANTPGMYITPSDFGCGESVRVREVSVDMRGNQSGNVYFGDVVCRIVGMGGEIVSESDVLTVTSAMMLAGERLTFQMHGAASLSPGTKYALLFAIPGSASNNCVRLGLALASMAGQKVLNPSALPAATPGSISIPEATTLNGYALASLEIRCTGPEASSVGDQECFSTRVYRMVNGSRELCLPSHDLYCNGRVNDCVIDDTSDGVVFDTLFSARETYQVACFVGGREVSYRNYSWAWDKAMPTTDEGLVGGVTYSTGDEMTYRPKLNFAGSVLECPEAAFVIAWYYRRGGMSQLAGYGASKTFSLSDDIYLGGMLAEISCHVRKRVPARVVSSGNRITSVEF